MKFTDIRPFVRYARYLIVDDGAEYPDAIPRDCRLFYTAVGDGSIRVDERVYTLKQGSLLFIRAGVKYRLLSQKHSATYIAVNFDFTQNFAEFDRPIGFMRNETYNPALIFENVEFEDLPAFGSSVLLENMAGLAEEMLTLEKEYAVKSTFYQARMNAVLLDVLLTAGRTLCTAYTHGAPELPVRVLNYLRENFARDITNEEIGAKFRLHPNYISDAVKKYTGIPVHRYLLFIRLSAAMEMLDAGEEDSISRIAMLCGFRDLYYFSRYFKKFTGFSPSDYRKERRRIAELGQEDDLRLPTMGNIL
ncbi:MAG: AraC family transcriptional regulator [Clostridia bacterium]|nr:AraC family transcriptional regulator [Clostridia bacterium]